MVRTDRTSRKSRLGTVVLVLCCLVLCAEGAMRQLETPPPLIDTELQIQDRDSHQPEADPLEQMMDSYLQTNLTDAPVRRATEQKATTKEPTTTTPITQPANPDSRMKRLLVSITDYYDTFFIQLPQFVQVSNILIVAAMLTNNFELLMPAIEYTQMFFFIGFFNILKGKFGQFFVGFNSGKIDPYRLLGAMFPFQWTQQAGLPDPVANAGMNASILCNLLPDIALIVITSLTYLLTKLLTVCIKSEIVRKINFAFKSIWNGLVYVEAMRFCFFLGLQSRFIAFNGLINYVEVAVLGVVAAVIIGFPVKLGLDIKGFVDDRDNTQLMTSIGLIQQLDHDKQFEFDCLHYSNMYYPVMNYVRHVIFFASIGASFDITKIQIGGTIVALFLYFTVFFNEPPHKNRRNNVTNFISNLIILALICCFISIDIAETINHPEISAPLCFMTLLLYLLGLVFHILMVLVEIVFKIIDRKKEKAQEGVDSIVKENLEEIKREEKARFKRSNNTTDNEKAIFGISSNSERSNASGLEDEKPKETSKFDTTSVRVKKVKNARII